MRPPEPMQEDHRLLRRVGGRSRSGDPSLVGNRSRLDPWSDGPAPGRAEAPEGREQDHDPGTGTGGASGAPAHSPANSPHSAAARRKRLATVISLASCSSMERSRSFSRSRSTWGRSSEDPQR